MQAVGEVQPDPFRKIILFLLLGLAGGAWVALVLPSHDMTMHMTMASSITGLHALRFLAIWVVMMVAMMLPTAVPMILAFHSAQTDKRRPDVAFDSNLGVRGGLFVGVGSFGHCRLCRSTSRRCRTTRA